MTNPPSNREDAAARPAFLLPQRKESQHPSILLPRTLSNAIVLREGCREDISEINALYRRLGYKGAATTSDFLLVADKSGVIIAAVRICDEVGHLVLRGMYVAEQYRFQGIGTTMLKQLEKVIENRDCYCIPWSTLTTFYGKGGFRVADVSDAPAHLKERLGQYLNDGKSVCLMKGEAVWKYHE